MASGTTGDPIELLSSLELFSELSEETVAAIAAAADRRILERNDVLFAEQDEPGELFVVVAGRIAIANRSEDGRESLVALMERGDLFGEMPLFDQGRRSAEARALESSEVLAIPYGPLRDLYQRQPELLWRVVALLAERLRTMDAALADSVFLDVTGRTAKRLLELAGDDDEFALPVTQEELAGMVGASRERVNKAIASFVRLEWIEQRDRHYVITNRQQLEIRPVDAMRIVLPSGTPAELAKPADGQARRGVVLLADIGGLRPLFDDLCAQLAAEHGWAVCAPEPFPGRETELDSLEKRFAAMSGLADDRQLGDALEAADATGCDTVAVLGFCMGGMYALKAAGTGRFDKAVAFYGMVKVPDDWQGEGHGEPLDAVQQSGAAEVLAIIGTADPYTPEDHVEELEAAGATVVRYEGADHGFVHDPSRPAHRPDDAEDAWTRVAAFLDTP